MSPVAAIVLAAGRSTRMGSVNKLTAPLGGKPLVAYAVMAALASVARPVIVVTGHEGERVVEVLAGLGAIAVHNPDFASGLASSLQVGLRAVPADATGAVIMLGDMPAISAGLLDDLLTAFARQPACAAVVPTWQGRWGNPVVLARRMFAPVMQLRGDEGARRLLAREAVVELAVENASIDQDVDTPDALARIVQNFSGST